MLIIKQRKVVIVGRYTGKMLEEDDEEERDVKDGRLF